ncbi:MAG: thermonuclease family protein [Moorea sp. SIO2B7]|nr:thermonuclease family protein [Moorena sp. SIO2B7]
MEWLKEIMSQLGTNAKKTIEDFLGVDRYKVKRVPDGDTIVVTDSKGEDINIRFAYIDSPEVAHTREEKKSRKHVFKSQFKWGEKAKKRLEELIEEGGGEVRLTIIDTDRYGRKVSEVHLRNGTFVQEVLVKEGLVQVYHAYLKDNSSATILKEAEADAKRRRRGLWRDPKFIPAWEFRRLKDD